MNRKIYWVLGVLILLFGGFMFYVHLDHAKFREDLEKKRPKLDVVHTEVSDKEKDTSQVVSNEPLTQEPDDSITNSTDKPITQKKDNVNGIQPTKTNSDNEKTVTAEPVRMSPHGFGSYPEIPDGAPIPQFDESDDVGTELMLRVAVKAWNEGERFESGFYNSLRDRVYLNYSDLAYVEYSDQIVEETGKKTGKRKITGVFTTSDNKDLGRMIFDGNIPVGIRLIDIDESGIDPYEYLDLP